MSSSHRPDLEWLHFAVHERRRRDRTFLPRELCAFLFQGFDIDRHGLLVRFI